MAMVVFSALLGSTVAVPLPGVPQVQLLDKVLVPVVCYDRPSCSRQFRNLWRSHRCRPSGCNGGSMDYAFTLAQQFVVMPAVVQRQVLVSTCRITAEVSAVAFHGVTGRLFWAVYTGTRPGFPCHQGGEGVAGTPGACSQVFCHPN